jgi:hypothetical protein
MLNNLEHCGRLDSRDAQERPRRMPALDGGGITPQNLKRDHFGSFLP